MKTLAMLAFLLAAPPAVQTKQVISIEKGKSATIDTPFAIGAGANSNPKVVQATVRSSTRIVLTGRRPGIASYVVFDAASDESSIEYEVHVREPARADASGR